MISIYWLAAYASMSRWARYVSGWIRFLYASFLFPPTIYTHPHNLYSIHMFSGRFLLPDYVDNWIKAQKQSIHNSCRSWTY